MRLCARRALFLSQTGLLGQRPDTNDRRRSIDIVSRLATDSVWSQYWGFPDGSVSTKVGTARSLRHFLLRPSRDRQCSWPPMK